MSNKFGIEMPSMDEQPRQESAPEKETPRDPKIAGETLEGWITRKTGEWSDRVRSLNGSFRRLSDTRDSMNDIYNCRQDVVEHLSVIMNKVASMSRDYKVEYARRYNALKTGSSIRYSTDASINAQIAADLNLQIYQMDLVSNYVKFLENTIRSVDDLVYSVQHRIKLEELIRDGE